MRASEMAERLRRDEKLAVLRIEKQGPRCSIREEIGQRLIADGIAYVALQHGRRFWHLTPHGYLVRDAIEDQEAERQRLVAEGAGR